MPLLKVPDDTDAQFGLLLSARKQFGQGGVKRIQYTLVPLVFAALRLSQVENQFKTKNQHTNRKTLQAHTHLTLFLSHFLLCILSATYRCLPALLPRKHYPPFLFPLSPFYFLKSPTMPTVTIRRLPHTLLSFFPCAPPCMFLASLQLVRKREIEATATPPPMPPAPASVEEGGGAEGEEGAAAAAVPAPAAVAPPLPPAPLKYSSRKIFQFVHEIVSALASSGYPDLSLKLFLQVS